MMAGSVVSKPEVRQSITSKEHCGTKLFTFIWWSGRQEERGAEDMEGSEKRGEGRKGEKDQRGQDNINP